MLDRRSVFVAALAALILCCSSANAQRKRRRPAGAGRLITEFPVPERPPIDVAAATTDALSRLIALEEEGGQWPYEGVYREDRGALPQGYRVGGTSISILGMVCAPGYSDDERRVDAVGRALRFVLKLSLIHI